MDAVDVHSHFFPSAFVRLIQSHGGPSGASVDRRDGVEWLTMPGHPPVPLTPQFTNVAARQARLWEMGIAAQAVSLSPPMVHWAPVELGIQLARVFNDGILELQTSFPNQFVGLATLPLQDVDATLREMDRAVGLGMRGIYVATAVGGRYLDAPQFAPMWEAAATRRIPVFIHPQHYLGREALDRWHLFNSVGFPVETAVLASRLIFSGLLDRHPSLRIVLAHGGGVLPVLAGRLDHTYRQRPEVRDAIPALPSTYVKRFYFDTVTHHDLALRFLVDLVGPQQIVLGTDTPYDMADPDPVARIRRLGLSPEAASAVLGESARRLLHWEVKPAMKEG
jgi:aminocarboxymuconate-semialdehyde decarboxylase